MAIDLINQMSYDPGLRLAQRLRAGGGGAGSAGPSSGSGSTTAQRVTLFKRAQQFLTRQIALPRPLAFLANPLQSAVRATALGIPGIMGSVETAGARTIIGGAGRLLTRGVESFGKAFSPTAIKARGIQLAFGIPAVTAISYALTGKLQNPFSQRKIAGYAGYALGGVPAILVGALTSGYTGGVSLSKKVASDVAGGFEAGGKMFKDYYEARDWFGPFGDTQAPSFQIAGPQIAFPAISLSGGGGTSVSVGGGPDPAMIALIAALFGGGAGYALGKRKRRKKYKRGKRRK